MGVDEHFWVTAGTVLLVTAVVFGVLFLAAYLVLARWWENPTGWYLFFSSLILSVILFYNMAAYLGWVTGEWRVGARFLVYLGALTIMVWRGVLLIAAQWELYQERKRAGAQKW